MREKNDAEKRSYCASTKTAAALLRSLEGLITTSAPYYSAPKKLRELCFRFISLHTVNKGLLKRDQLVRLL